MKITHPKKNYSSEQWIIAQGYQMLIVWSIADFVSAENNHSCERLLSITAAAAAIYIAGTETHLNICQQPISET